jgi:hypothetical protein
MLRRGFSIVLILGYLAGQLAAVPHAHGQGGENQPCDHNARPHIHIHVSWFSHFGHFHDDHSHDDEHTHHHECGGSHSHPAFSDSNAGHDDHDNDAVYLASDTGVSLLSKRAESPDCLQFVSAQVIAATPTPAAIAEPWAIAYSPGEFSPRCPLYLALRTLRI